MFRKIVTRRCNKQPPILNIINFIIKRILIKLNIFCKNRFIKYLKALNKVNNAKINKPR